MSDNSHAKRVEAQLRMAEDAGERETAADRSDDGSLECWPPDLNEVRDLDAIVEAIESHDDVEEVKRTSERRGMTTSITVRLGGPTPSTTEFTDLYRKHDLRAVWSMVHPTGALYFKIGAKPEVVDA